MLSWWSVGFPLLLEDIGYGDMTPIICYTAICDIDGFCLVWGEMIFVLPF